MLQIETVASTAVGSGMAIFLFRYFVMKILKDVDNIAKELTVVTKELSIIAVKLEQMDRARSIIHEHDRKIVSLEAALYGLNKSH